MSEPEAIYEKLAYAMDTLPNRFPRTQSRVEIQILKKIFSIEEASIAGQLTGTASPVAEIALRIGLSAEQIKHQLIDMAKRGLVWFEIMNGKPVFRLAPFIVGIYEAQARSMDHELAHLVENYMHEGGAAGIMKPQPALHRVVPAQGTVKQEWIMPYDEVRTVLLSAKTFVNNDCICRLQQEAVGHTCSFPRNLCLGFSNQERSPQPGDISQAEALDLLAKAEEIGLVHTVSNVAQGLGYVCNCCGCCCGILRGINDFGIADSVACANYYAAIDPVLCGGCGVCIDRCQVHAITDQDGISWVDRSRCIGCGLCVTGCTNDAASLVLKPEEEMVHPPFDFPAWEHARMINRES